jgi:hypothetical protein
MGKAGSDIGKDKNEGYCLKLQGRRVRCMGKAGSDIGKDKNEG